MQKSDVELVLGPPGTGKTTTLLNLLEQAMLQGVKPSSIGFISFTRKAAEEARDRAAARFGFNKEDMPWFRTLHSLCFRCLGLSRSQIMNWKHYRQVADSLGVRITVGTVRSEDGEVLQGVEKGDRMLFYTDLSRNKMISAQELLANVMDDDMNWPELKRFGKTLFEFKKEFGLNDFTDVLEKFADHAPWHPALKILFIDEAQDLSRLQWRAVARVINTAGKTYIAGDDDQAIYAWAGADVDTFLRIRQGRKSRVLEQSYRLPRKVFDTATGVVNRIQRRYEKTRRPREADGALEFVVDPFQLDMSQGEWLVLARNHYFLESFEASCRQRGWSYESRSWSQKRSTAVRAVRNWIKLESGGELDANAVREIYSFMELGKQVKRGFKSLPGIEDDRIMRMADLRSGYGLLVETPWMESLPGIDRTEASYIKSLLEGEGLEKEPRIKLSTIHGAKGGEAQNVVVMSDMSGRTYQGFLQNPDDEHRTFYVAVTRAKERLILCAPTSPKHYEI